MHWKGYSNRHEANGTSNRKFLRKYVPVPQKTKGVKNLWYERTHSPMESPLSKIKKKIQDIILECFHRLQNNRDVLFRWVRAPDLWMRSVVHRLSEMMIWTPEECWFSKKGWFPLSTSQSVSVQPTCLHSASEGSQTPIHRSHTVDNALLRAHTM